MNIPVHKNNLLPRGKQVDNYIIIEHSYYGEYFVEVWKRFFGSYYTHLYTYPSLKLYKEFVEDVKKYHTLIHSYLPCKCSIGKAFTKLSTEYSEKDEVE